MISSPNSRHLYKAYTNLTTSTTFTRHDRTDMSDQSRSRVFELSLGAPSMPWDYIVSPRDFFSSQGLLKVSNVAFDSKNPTFLPEYLMFPSTLSQQGPNSKPIVRLASAIEWKERENLCYYLNIHLLGREGGIGRGFRHHLLANKLWYPGQVLDPKAQQANKSIPVVPLSDLHLWTFMSSDHRIPLESRPISITEDVIGSVGDLLWEVDCESIDSTRYKQGRECWNGAFKKHFLKQLNERGRIYFTELGILPSSLHRRNHSGTLSKANYHVDYSKHIDSFLAHAGAHLTASNPTLTVKEKKALDRFSKQWFYNTKDALEKSYNTTLRNLENARKNAELLIASLRTITDENDLPDGWILTFLNLRVAELQVDGYFSSLSANLLTNLNNITSVLDAVLRTPTSHSHTARHIATSPSEINELENLTHVLEANKTTSVEPDGSIFPFELSTRSLEAIRRQLECNEGLLSGMNPMAPKLLWHQLIAVVWLVEMLCRDEQADDPINSGNEGGLLLGDAPGLGKTLIVLAMLAWVYAWDLRARTQTGGTIRLQGMSSLNDAKGPVFILTPTSIQSQWKSEAEAWMARGSFEFFEYPTQSKENEAWWNNWEHSKTPLQRRVIIICYSTLVREYNAIFEATSADPIKAKLAQRKSQTTLSRTLYGLDPWLVAADEAHTAKNIRTAKFRAVHHVMWSAAIRIAITATPIHNQLEDMLNLIIMIQMKCTTSSKDNLHHKLIDGHLRKYLPILRSRARQHRLYCSLEASLETPQDSITVSQSRILSEGIRFGRDFLAQAVRLIIQLASRSMIRREQSSVDWGGEPLLILPTKTVTRHDINLTPQEHEWYIEESRAARAGKNNDIFLKTPSFYSNERRGLIHIASSMSTSKDISQWLSSSDAPSDIRRAARRPLSTRALDPTPSSKLNAAVDIVRRILAEDTGKVDAERRKVIVFCLWVGLWPTIEAYFAFENIPIVLLSSSDTAAARSALLMDFQKEGPHSTKDGRDSWVAMITSSYSAGVNMTRASVLVQLDATWSYEEERQVHGRAHRYGQRRRFEVHQFEAHRTVDTLLLSLSSTKEALMELFSAEAEVPGTDSDMEEMPQPPLSPRKRYSPYNARELTPILLDEFERRKAVLCTLLRQPINPQDHAPLRINIDDIYANPPLSAHVAGVDQDSFDSSQLNQQIEETSIPESPSSGMDMSGGPFFDYPTELDSFDCEEVGKKSMPGVRYNLLGTPCSEPAAASDMGYILPVNDISPPGTPNVRRPQQSASSMLITSSINNFNQVHLTRSPTNRIPSGGFSLPQQGPFNRETDTVGVSIVVSDDLSSKSSVDSTRLTSEIGYGRQVSGTPSQESSTTPGLLVQEGREAVAGEVLEALSEQVLAKLDGGSSLREEVDISSSVPHNAKAWKKYRFTVPANQKATPMDSYELDVEKRATGWHNSDLNGWNLRAQEKRPEHGAEQMCSEAGRHISPVHVRGSYDQSSDKGLDDDQQQDQSDIARAQVDVNQKEKTKKTHKPSAKAKETEHHSQYDTPDSCLSSTDDFDTQSDIYVPGQDSRSLSFNDSTSSQDVISSEEDEELSLAAVPTKTRTRKDSRKGQGKTIEGRTSKKRPRKSSESEASGARELDDITRRRLGERPLAKPRKKYDATPTATTQAREGKRLKYDKDVFGLFGTG